MTERQAAYSTLAVGSAHSSASTIIDLMIAADVVFAKALEGGGAALDAIRAGLAAALDDLASDAQTLDTARLEGQIVGITCITPASQIPMRRLATLRHILSKLRTTAKLRRALTEFSAGIPPMDDEGLYLTRIATAQHVRGIGIGSRMMDRFEAGARDAGHGVTKLHVAVDNTRALAFYHRRGYRAVATGATHLLLCRTERN